MSINKAILIGNVGKDPEVRYLESGVAVANFTMATTERGYTAANGTAVPDRTEWHNIVLWRGLAEVAEKYVRKGTKIYVEGRIKTRSYDGPDGSKRYVTEIWGDNMELLTPRQQDGQNPAQNYPAPGAPKAAAPSASTFNQPSATPAPKVDLEEETDDLPF